MHEYLEQLPNIIKTKFSKKTTKDVQERILGLLKLKMRKIVEMYNTIDHNMILGRSGKDINNEVKKLKDNNYGFVE